MKEHPIIITTSLIPATLEGRKTQTRRVIKPQPNYDDGLYDQGWLWGGLFHNNESDLKQLIALSGKCPYGQVGDRLLIKETHKLTRKPEGVICQYKDGEERYFNWADIPQKQQARLERIKTWGRWRSPRFMYNFLVRHKAEITNVRVERLQEITEDDATKEGFKAQEQKTWWQGYDTIDLGKLGTELMHTQATGDKPPDWMIEPHRMLDRPDLESLFSARSSFRAKWDSLNAKRGYGWDTNCWVWVISFRRLTDGECIKQ